MSEYSDEVQVEYCVARLNENPISSMLQQGNKIVISGEDVLKCSIDDKTYLGQIHESIGSDIIMNDKMNEVVAVTRKRVIFMEEQFNPTINSTILPQNKDVDGASPVDKPC